MSTTFEDTRVPTAAAGLGAAGLIPFFAGAAGLWLSPMPDARQYVGPLLGYGAVILSFMGAVHWGLALAAAPRQGTAPPARWFALSVIPALSGWAALLLEPMTGLCVLILGFGGVFWLDLRSIAAGLAPAWYLRLRAPLSLLVGSALLVSIGALMFRG